MYWRDIASCLKREPCSAANDETTAAFGGGARAPITNLAIGPDLPQGATEFALSARAKNQALPLLLKLDRIGVANVAQQSSASSKANQVVADSRATILRHQPCRSCARPGAS